MGLKLVTIVRNRTKISGKFLPQVKLISDEILFWYSIILFYCSVMFMITSQILLVLDSSKTQKPKYYENEKKTHKKITHYKH